MEESEERNRDREGKGRKDIVMEQRYPWDEREEIKPADDWPEKEVELAGWVARKTFR